MRTFAFRRLLAPMLVLTALVFTGAASADSCAEAQRQILATDRQLELVGPVVRSSGDHSAMDLYVQATGMQDQAKLALGAGRCDLASRRSEKAYDFANQALLKARPGAGDQHATPDYVQRELERTDELIRRVATRVKDSGDDRAQIMLDRATQTQAQAWALFRGLNNIGGSSDSRLKGALELTMKARDGARQAYNVAGDGSGMNPDRVAEELRQTDEQIATAVEWSRTTAGPGSSAAQQISMARALEENARRRFEQRQYPEALSMTLRARDMVRRVLSGTAQVAPADLEREMDAAGAALDRARAATLQPAGAHRLAQAEIRYSRAVEQRDSGHPWVALMNARAARNLALRAMGTPP